MSLNQFKSGFYGGTRQNRFLISGNFPAPQDGSITSNTSGANSSGGSFYHVRSTLIPTLQTSTISYDYFGRKYNYPGEKLYSTWSVSVMDDNPAAVSVTYNLWKRFQQWHDWINNHQTNTTLYINYPDSYKSSWTVRHLDLNGSKVLKEFTMHGCWPSTVSQLSLNMMTPNNMNMFSVVVVFDYIEITGITSRT